MNKREFKNDTGSMAAFNEPCLIFLLENINMAQRFTPF